MLGDSSFMRCSITCVLSPDWVALKCKYLWNKAAIWDGVGTEGHCVVWGEGKKKKQLPTETFSLKTRLPKSLFKKTDYLFLFFISLCASSLCWDWVFFFWVPFPSCWKPAAVPPPPPHLSMKWYPPPGSCSTWRTQIIQNSRQFWNISFLLLSLCSYFPGVSQLLLISFELNIELDWKLRTCWYCTCTTLPSCFGVLARLWLRIGTMIRFLFSQT